MTLLRNAVVGHDAVTLPSTMGHIGLVVGNAGEPVDPVEPPVDEEQRDEPIGDIWSGGHDWHMDCPAAFAYVLTGHAMHIDIPATGLYIPTAQS
jgi:hypothetical protein